MPDRIRTLDWIIKTGMAAVIRAKSSDHLMQVADAIKEGGIDVIEVTMTTPDALKVIEETARKYGDEVLIGVGTVLDAETCRLAILAGAEFVVGPCLDRPMIEMAHRYDKLVMPGCFTPTEILQAWNWGADLVKVFPADILGPTFFKDILGPLPQVRMVPTGGVALDTAADFLKAGCVALCAGSSLIDKTAVVEGRFGAVTETARQFREIIDATRAEMKAQ
ncbi:MAG TPA: bifunctional 4-hydroxy-2-oxoglutarate aldolase/2-dehydro-3-deoxy-phosphogluconate aldolase [Armatimonadota bacterium]|nr:bifunctional 4-hydroxy-2-oxoglutarate aldolase/2-dehydro-3-deoxy-phosphogluconate aldolase [Armatimonadota bacterium]